MATRASFGKLSLTIPTIMDVHPFFRGRNPMPCGHGLSLQEAGRGKSPPKVRPDHQTPVKGAGRNHRRRMLPFPFTEEKTLENIFTRS